jgi:hypothetical protein
MSSGTKRSIFRWIHLILSIPIIGYIYSPFEKFQITRRLPGLFSFRGSPFRGCGCGRAMWCGGFSRNGPRNRKAHRSGFELRRLRR